MANHPSTLVQTPGNIGISSEEEFVLQHLFSRFVRVAIEAEFGMGLSGCRVFRVRPVAADRVAHTPVLVKIGPVDLIEKEWGAYETWVKDKLTGIALVTSPPIFPNDNSWGGLLYQLVGGGIFDVKSLSQFYRQADMADVLWVLQKRLFPAMGRSWWLDNRAVNDFKLQSDYDHLLPVNLMLSVARAFPDDELTIIKPEQHAISQLMIGNRVRLQGFVVTEVEVARQQLTLNLPHPAGQRRYDSLRLRVHDVPSIDQYQVGDVLEAVDGNVTDTRLSLLQTEVDKALGPAVELTGDSIMLDKGKPLPNPLHFFAELLHNTFLHVNLSTIHGDFNLENILVDPDTRDVKVIDFATARQGHAPHDLLRLETEIITKILPEVFAQADLAPELIREFYWHLHYVSFDREARIGALSLHPLLANPMATFGAIRRQASKSFFEPADHDEYYQGLVLYLLGALKFKNLDAIPGAKALAFYGAATTVEILEGPIVPVDPTQKPFPVPEPQNTERTDTHHRSWIKIGAMTVFLLAIAGIAYYLISNIICTKHLCALDDQLTVAFVEGPAAHDDLADYFAAANPALYAHLDAVEQAYLDGEVHKGLTYVWGPPGVGKSFVSRNRLRDEFPGESCLIKLSDLSGQSASALNIDIIDLPDLTTVDKQIVFSTLPAIANTSDFELENLLSDEGCRNGERWVPLIIIDDIDEIHSDSSKTILKSLDRFIVDMNLTRQEFVHVVVLGRTEGFAPWYQDPRRTEEISEYLRAFWLLGPKYVTIGDIEFLAENQWGFLCGQAPPPGFVAGYVEFVTRHPILTYSIRSLAISTFIVNCDDFKFDLLEVELKAFLLNELLRRAHETHGRPAANDEQYIRILEEIATKYARPDDLVDDEGFFIVSDLDTVPVIENGRRVGEVSVRDVLDHSGIAILKNPANYLDVRYRFDPVWVQAHLVELRNERRLPFIYQYCPCDE